MSRRVSANKAGVDSDLARLYFSLKTAVSVVTEGRDTAGALRLLLSLAIDAIAPAEGRLFLRTETPTASQDTHTSGIAFHESDLDIDAESRLRTPVEIASGMVLDSIQAGKRLILRDSDGIEAGLRGVPHSSLIVVLPLDYRHLVLGAMILWRTDPGFVSDQAMYHAEEMARQAALLLALDEWGRMARTDELTGFHNSRALNELLESESQRALNRPYSVIMLEIDDFRHLNNIHGHQAGNVVLRDVANVLRTRARQGDYVTRMGGDEFVILLRDTDKPTALLIAERLRNAVAGACIPQGATQPNGKITISAGVASYPDDAATPDDLIKCADEAVYRSKMDGKDRVTAYVPGIKTALGDYQATKILGTLDPVSGLYDTSYLTEQLALQVRLARHFQRKVWVVLIDVDEFRVVNEQYGAAAGDRVLRSLALETMNAVGEPSMVCRGEGDEIVVILPDKDESQAMRVAEDIRLRIPEMRLHVSAGGEDSMIRLTVSLGLACFPDHAVDAQDLLMKSKLALLRAKDLGRNVSSIYVRAGETDALP